MASTNFEYPKIDWDSEDLYQEFSRFRNHVGFVFDGPLSKLNDKQKSGWLGTWIGSQGREIYKIFEWTEGEKDDPQKVLDKFESYTRPRKNKRIARHKLRQRKQKQSESFDNFVKDLRLILLDCEYSNPDDILIDAIIEGVYEKKLQEKLLYQGEELTLAKALTIGQQYELAQKQIKIVRDENSAVAAVHGVDSDNYREKQQFKHKQSKKGKASSPNKKEKGPTTHGGRCNRCGKDPQHLWNKGKCPAVGSTCSYCKKPNHWLAVCQRRRKLHLVETSSESESDTESLHVVQICSETESDEVLLQIHTAQTVNAKLTDKWDVTVKVLQRQVKFRIDTGARCNTLTLADYQTLKHKGELQQSTKILRTYSNHQIKPIAAVDLNIQQDNKAVTTTFQVIDLSQENILSGNTAEQLGLISRINVASNITTDLPEGLDEFPDLLNTTGTLPGTYTIKLTPNAKGVVHPARRLPVSLKKQTIEKLSEMEKNGIISKVEQPTEWVSSMVVNIRNNKLRICIDPRELNQAIKREHYPMRTVEEIVAEIPDAKIFSILDAKSGFHQIKLDEESSLLTTFNTPIGRYRWLRLPFGLKCAPEIFQRIMDQMLEGIEGAFAIVDDILVAGRDQQQHDQILKQVIERATSYNLTLNMEKCRIRQKQVPYVGHLLTSDGLLPDPEKLVAIRNMPIPQNKEDVKRFLGFVTYLGKFIPNLSEVDAPLRALLKTGVSFDWQSAQEQAFNTLKDVCSKPPVLKFYDASKPVEIHCDASKNGLGAVLMQDSKPVAYSSRSMTSTETRYAQLEKEMLSIVHACKKFHCYIFGKETTVYNDHKPLEQIWKKPLLAAPMRLQRMMLALQWYDLKIHYRPGKEMYLPDTLSRAYLPESKPEISSLDQVNAVDFLSITKEKYTELQECTERELNELTSVIIDGWPDSKKQLPNAARPYWDSRSELAILDGIVYKGMRIVVPPSQHKSMLNLIHKSHLGIGKCKKRAREVLYWPTMNSDIEQSINNCSKCADFQKHLPSEPLTPTETPDLPFLEVGTDLFEFECKNYLLTVDYYSRFIEVDKLKDIQSKTVIEALKSQFSRHGIPEILRSDCGLQYMSAEFANFCKDYGIIHKQSSPYFPSSNGEAERAIQTVKGLWKKTTDKHLALLDYRTTPLDGINLSPAQLLMGRRPRNTLPSARALLVPKSYNRQDVKRHFNLEKAKQKYYHDKTTTKELSQLQPGEQVRMAPLPGTKRWLPATVIQHHSAPRSYVVKSRGRQYRRNRRHLRTSTEAANAGASSESEDLFENNLTSSEETPQPQPSTRPGLEGQTNSYVTRSGRTVKPSTRLNL